MVRYALKHKYSGSYWRGRNMSTYVGNIEQAKLYQKKTNRISGFSQYTQHKIENYDWVKIEVTYVEVN